MNFTLPDKLNTKTEFNHYDWFKDVFMPAYRLNANIQAISEVSSRAGAPFFEVDYESKIAEKLQIKANTKNFDLRFPLVALILNDEGTTSSYFEEEGSFFSVPINLWFIHQSKAEYDTEYRLENIFKPILYKMYYAFWETMAELQVYFSDEIEELAHDKIDRFYCQFELGNRINEFADGIQINNFNLNFSKNYCKQ